MAYTPSGGFLPNQVLSPPPSAVASSVSSRLPQPRTRPLKAGTRKESALLLYLDQNILHIKRRFAKRLDSDETPGAVNGYQSFKDAGEDIDRLIDVIWVSATRTRTPRFYYANLQIPYLLSIALLALTCLIDLPLAPKSMFNVLDKLDHAFSSLILGIDLESGHPLPGFETGRRLSDTDKVRVRSIVEQTRVRVVEVMSMNEEQADDERVEETDTDMDDFDMESEEDELDIAETQWEREIATVYERTIVELGGILEAPSSTGERGGGGSEV